MAQMKQPEANPIHWSKTFGTQLKCDNIHNYKNKALTCMLNVTECHFSGILINFLLITLESQHSNSKITINIHTISYSENRIVIT
jgi:hypothetical protein